MKTNPTLQRLDQKRREYLGRFKVWLSYKAVSVLAMGLCVILIEELGPKNTWSKLALAVVMGRMISPLIEWALNKVLRRK